MRSELAKKIRAACPNIVFEADFLTFGCRNGWFALLLDLFTEINALPGADRHTIRQVKSKFAELRFYVASPHDDPDLFTEAIRKAALRSCVTCETCGEPGRALVNDKGWQSVACEAHRKPNDRNPREDELEVGTRWFGPKWDASICAPHNRVETPDDDCYLCGEGFTPEDRGLVFALLEGPDDPSIFYEHLDCATLSGKETPKTV